MSDPVEMTWTEAAARFGLAHDLQAWDSEQPVRVWKGDVSLDSLDLNDGSFVVTGNLTLTHDLCSSDDASGFLVVFGNLDVRNVLSGGGQITVRGSVIA